MRLIDSCYFCTTPYQIIAAVSIVRHNHETADLYVFFKNEEYYIRKIREENIFSKVVYVKNTRRRFTHHMSGSLNTLRCYIQYKKIAQEILIPNTIYDKLYFSNKITSTKCCFFYYIKKNIPVQRILFDDGAGSYMNDYYDHISKKDAFVRFLFFGKQAIEPISDKMLYSPDLYKITNKATKCNVKKIYGEFDHKETKELYNRIFQFKESDLIKEDCILLDCVAKEILDKSGQKKLQSIYNKIFQACGTQNIIVKSHPRDNAAPRDGIKYYTNCKLPIECLYMNLNCNEKVLIAVSSTAIVTPKILFDQEPYILLLYKLLHIKSLSMNQDDLNSFYTNCKKLYKHPERFMIPETEEELNVCLGQIKNVLQTK